MRPVVRGRPTEAQDNLRANEATHEHKRSHNRAHKQNSRAYLRICGTSNLRS